MTVVDLGAAPGSWCQFAVRQIGASGRVVAVDIEPMDALSGVQTICGDIRSEQTQSAIGLALGGQSAHLLLSDMAPGLTGIGAHDQANTVELLTAVIRVAGAVLRPGGKLLFKAFQGGDFAILRQLLEPEFPYLKTIKPEASRQQSREVYLLARRARQTMP